MKYYSAVVNEDEIKATTVTNPKTILMSYHYFKNKKELVKQCVEKHYDIFIDSGAFSAMNSNKEINIDEYCNFIKETGVIRYATLDVIGNAEKTLENHKYMKEQHGLKPIIAFHMGSSLKDLEKLMSENYIALGGLVYSEGIMRHCDEVWSFILKNNPKLKVHGFGLSNIELMARYPWYSVDSSSFKSCKRFGRQDILWNGFEFKTFTEDEYLEHLKVLGYDTENLTNKQKWFIYDYFSSESYKLYALHLREVNKLKNFDYLTDQQKLF